MITCSRILQEVGNGDEDQASNTVENLREILFSLRALQVELRKLVQTVCQMYDDEELIQEVKGLWVVTPKQ